MNTVLWQFPGGKVERGEQILDAANRELQEESGLRANTVTPLGKYLVNNRRSDAFMHVVLAEDCVDSRLRPDSEEEIISQWVTQEELHSLMNSGDIINVHILAGLELLRNHKEPHPVR